jgi:sulfite reductase (NADPH) hemoprotein beta-component
LPGLVTQLETVLRDLGLGDDDISIRMTGCPNGCARPYLAEIGIVGRGPGTYHLYLGGSREGVRLNKLYRRDLDGPAIVGALAPLFAAYAADRKDGEFFGDYLIRVGTIALTTAGLNFHDNLSSAART